MSSKFHIAMFCSVSAYAARKSFYSAMFGVEGNECTINDGTDGREYEGSIWDRNDGYHFALLKSQDLKEQDEKLAHIGFMFDSIVEFNTEIQKRGIKTERIKEYTEGHKQVFIDDNAGFEWEFLYVASGTTNKS